MRPDGRSDKMPPPVHVHPHARPLLLLLLLLALLVQLVGSELVLVYSIHRHGARNVLPKSSVSVGA